MIGQKLTGYDILRYIECQREKTNTGLHKRKEDDQDYVLFVVALMSITINTIGLGNVEGARRLFPRQVTGQARILGRKLGGLVRLPRR